MVHVWSINSGERFQGHHGPLVVKLGFLSQHCMLIFKELRLLFQKKDTNIKTIPAFKPIPADNATPDSTPEKSYNVISYNISLSSHSVQKITLHHIILKREALENIVGGENACNQHFLLFLHFRDKLTYLILV